MLTVDITFDMDLVKSILIRPDIWERAAEDGIDKEAFYPSYDSMSLWLLCKDEENIGIILIHTDTSISIKIHPYLMEEHRERGREMMTEFYKWFLENTDTHKINVIIPEPFRRVVNFSKKIGFKHEGFSEESYKKNGKIYGQYQLGITRNKVEEYLDGRNN